MISPRNTEHNCVEARTTFSRSIAEPNDAHICHYPRTPKVGQSISTVKMMAVHEYKLQLQSCRILSLFLPIHLSLINLVGFQTFRIQKQISKQRGSLRTLLSLRRLSKILPSDVSRKSSAILYSK
uniref:Uncharacterized protein n=1 Tax=Rhizophora mucronata TaxID=61149 RepID=A0A2P2LT72_RHIMU